MDKLREAARQVVANGVQGAYAKYYSVPPADFESLREALAKQAEQEPVCCDKCGSKLGTTVVPCDCATPMQQAEQEALIIDWEPLQNFWRNNSSIDWGELESAVKCAVAAPLAKQDTHATHVVRTKDLTDEELNDMWYGNTKDGWLGLFRAVIAADRELNK